jgi:hypothetical protein
LRPAQIDQWRQYGSNALLFISFRPPQRELAAKPIAQVCIWVLPNPSFCTSAHSKFHKNVVSEAETSTGRTNSSSALDFDTFHPHTTSTAQNNQPRNIQTFFLYQLTHKLELRLLFQPLPVLQIDAPAHALSISIRFVPKRPVHRELSSNQSCYYTNKEARMTIIPFYLFAL